MTRLQKAVSAGVLLLCFATLSYAGTITGSRTGASSSRVGTITGSRTGTITGSRAGIITGSRVSTITGTALSQKGSLDNMYDGFLFRLMSVILNGAF